MIKGVADLYKHIFRRVSLAHRVRRASSFGACYVT